MQHESVLRNATVEQKRCTANVSRILS